MTDEKAHGIVAAVASSRRYRDVAADVIERLAGEEASRARTRDEAVKRVKRRLHQSVGAYATRRRTSSDRELASLSAAAAKEPGGEAVRGLCLRPHGAPR